MKTTNKLGMDILLRTAYYLNEEDRNNMEEVFSIPKKRLDAVRARERIQLLREHFSESLHALMDHRSLLMRLNVLRLPSFTYSTLRHEPATYIYDQDTVQFWKRLLEVEMLFRQVCLTRYLRERPGIKELVQKGILPEYAERISSVLVTLIWQLEHQNGKDSERVGVHDEHLPDLKQLLQFWTLTNLRSNVSSRKRVNEQELREVRTKERIARYESLINHK
jgi:hypothetical protein